MDMFRSRMFEKNPYLHVLVILIVSKFILFSSEFFALIYEETIFKFLPDTSFIINLVELSSFIFITLMVVFCARKIYKLSWKTLGFTRKSALKDFFKGWGLGAVVLISCVSLMMIFGVVKIDKVEFNSQLLLQFIPLLIAWSIQGNAEEALTRGLLFTSIARKLNILTAILISSIFFTLMHLGNDGLSLFPLIDLFVFGVLASLVLIKTKNIWVISGFHAAWNHFQGNIFTFPVSGTNVGNGLIHVTTHGTSWISGGKFGVEGSIISIVVQLILVIWLSYDLFIKCERSITDKFDLK